MSHAPITRDDLQRLEDRVEDVEASHERHRSFEAEIARTLSELKVGLEGMRVKVSLFLWLAGAIATGAIATAGAVITAIATRHP